MAGKPLKDQLLDVSSIGQMRICLQQVVTDNTRKVSRKQIKRYAGLLTRELDHFIVIPGKKLPPLIGR